VVVFVCSTTGDGDAPDEAIKFFKALRPRAPATLSLADWHVAILGTIPIHVSSVPGNVIKFAVFRTGRHQLHQLLQWRQRAGEAVQQSGVMNIGLLFHKDALF
jgi:sulfite reductase alpha subunit-like flavoprotein